MNLRLIVFVLGLLTFVSSAQAQKIKIKSPVKDAKKDSKKDAKKETEAVSANNPTSGSTAGSANVEMKFKVGDVAEALETDGIWYKVDIKKVEGGKYFIHWQGFDPKYDRWIEADKVRKLATGSSGTSSASTTAEFNVGDTVDVLGRSMWVTAVVLASKGTGLSAMYEVQETVSGKVWNASRNPVRIRKYTGPVVFNFTGKDFQKGQYVQVWYSGSDSLFEQILDVKDNEFLIKYGGYGETWFKFDAKELRNDVKTAAAAAARGAQNQFWQDCGPYQEPVLTFSWLENPDGNSSQKNSWTTRDQYWKEDERLALIKDHYAKLAELEKIVKEKGYESMATGGGAMSGKAATGNPTFLVKTALNREEYGAKLVRLVVKTDVDALKATLEKMPVLGTLAGARMLDHHDGALGTLSTKEFYFNDSKTAVEAVRARAAKFLQAIGKTEDTEVASMLTALQAAATDNKKAFAANLQQTSLPVFSIKDPEIESAAKIAIEKIIPGAVVMRTGMIDADWKISRNSLGVPESRLKYAGVVFKDPVTGWCAYAPMQMAQDYTSAGTYSTKTYISTLYGYKFRYYLAKCQ